MQGEKEGLGALLGRDSELAASVGGELIVIVDRQCKCIGVWDTKALCGRPSLALSVEC